MGRPPKPGEVRPPRKGPQGRLPGPFQRALSLRLTERGYQTLVAERRALQQQVEEGLLTALEASFSVVVERALLSHAARAQTPAGKAEDEQFLADLRARWRSDSPAPALLDPTTDLREMVRQELAKALQGEIPEILKALAGEAARTTAVKKKNRT